MKKPSSDLFELIKSLSKSEKSYFKKYSRMYSYDDIAYIKLFDGIERQVKKGNGYDEDILKKTFKGEKFVNQLPVAKNFLYNLILKNLVQYNLDESDNSRLHDMTGGVEVLCRRAFYVQGEKLLAKAKKLAYETENYLKLHELLQWEKNILAEKSEKNMMERYNEIYEEEQNALKILSEGSKIKNIYGQATAILSRAGYARDENTVKKFKEILKEPIMNDVEKLKSFQNKSFYYDIYVGYYAFVRDFENYYKYIRMNLELYEVNPLKIKKRLIDYMLVIHNYLSGCLYLKRYEEYKQNLYKYTKFYNSTKNKSTAYFRLLDILIRKHELVYYNSIGEFDKGIKFIEKYIKEVNEYKSEFDPRELNFIYYFSSIIYFGAKEYKKSLEYANLIINNGEPEQRKELYFSARLISIIIHYELKNIEYLDSHIRSTYRYLSSRKIEYRFEKFLIGFFKKILNKITEEELIELFDESKYKITKLMDDPYEVSGALYFDYVSWLESKLEKKNYSDIIRAKAKKINKINKSNLNSKIDF
jgi:hypothetical protein